MKKVLALLQGLLDRHTSRKNAMTFGAGRNVSVRIARRFAGLCACFKTLMRSDSLLSSRRAAQLPRIKPGNPNC